jgi:hypothetical protein
MPAHVIESTIEHLMISAIREETAGGFVIHCRDEGFPQTDEVRQHIARLEERLKIATEREAQRKHAMQVHRILELENLANDCWHEAFKIEKKIIRARCQDHADLMAKWQLYKSKPTHFDERGIGSSLTLPTSIARDAVALMQQSDGLSASLVAA